MTNNLGSQERPLRVAVIGSGPSGFYTVEALLAAPLNISVDLFDRLPAPFGLVRYGVAPDHQKIKNVIKIYEKIATNPRFGFFGNLHVGKDVSVDELRKFYDAIIFACGAQTDKRLGIPGEDLAGSHTATEFVAWYNGHPDYRDRKFDLSCEVAAIVGQGNVAMDVCRILCKTFDELKNTDISQHALDVLAKSRIKEVHLIGRRGPVQASFTPPEIKEFGELVNCDPVFDNLSDLELNPTSKIELEDLNYPIRRKNWEILQEFARRPKSNKSKRFIIHFLKSPVELAGQGKVAKVIFEKNKLDGPPNEQKAQETGQKSELPCGIFFRSVGYRGVPIPGVPFDDKRGIFPNKDGRVFDGEKVVNGLYASGWIKRGPSGVIGTNKPDSVATVQALLADVGSLSSCAMPDQNAFIQFLNEKQIKFVNFIDWKKIDAAEIERGKPLGKPREKFVKVDEMLAAAGKISQSRNLQERAFPSTVQ